MRVSRLFRQVPSALRAHGGWQDSGRPPANMGLEQALSDVFRPRDWFAQGRLQASRIDSLCYRREVPTVAPGSISARFERHPPMFSNWRQGTVMLSQISG